MEWVLNRTPLENKQTTQQCKGEQQKEPEVPEDRTEDCKGGAVGEDIGISWNAAGNEEGPEKYSSTCSESVKSRRKCLVSLRRRQYS